MLGDMRPRYAFDHVSDRAPSDAVTLPQFGGGNTGSVVRSDDWDDGLSENVRSVFSARDAFRHPLPPMMYPGANVSALNHIAGVFRNGSKIQMLNSHTCGIVSARASMQHKQAVWYRSVRQFPRNSGRDLRATTEVKASMASWRAPRAPQPAPIGLFNFGPETLFGCLGSGCDIAGVGAIADSPRVSGAAAVFAGECKLLGSHVTSSGSLVRDAFGGDNTGASRLFYPASSGIAHA
jgi:hypothetical protein